MVAKPVPAAGTSNASEAEKKVEEAHARVKAAAERQAAIIGVLSRVGVSAQEKRLAQVAIKKADRDLRDARRLLNDAHGAARKP